MENSSIRILALQAVEAMIQDGYKPITAWYQYENNLSRIVRMHEERHMDRLDVDVLSEYVEAAKERYGKGKISYNHFRYIVGSAERFHEFCTVGQWIKRKKGERTSLDGFFGSVIETVREDLKESTSWSERYLTATITTAKFYFEWLMAQGHRDFSAVTADTLIQFFICRSEQLSGKTIVGIKCQLKNLYACLERNGYVTDAFTRVFSFRVPVEEKILPAASKEEIAVVLSKIDRYTFIGKRDYAIILLGTVTGLRGVDIANLRLKDIDWQRGEIRIVQQKTGRALSLPLTTDVGEAMKDYILNGRVAPFRNPENTEDRVFLTAIAPHKGFDSGKAIGCIYSRNRISAGFVENNGFHSLRRAVGRDMVVAGVPITTVAQSLGQYNIDSTRNYMPLDSIHLKECALDFEGIEPGKKVGE